jgi:hypothetical protein
LFVSFSYKKLLQCSFYENLKYWCKNRLKIQKGLCITTKSLYTNSNFKRNYLENYNDSEHVVKTKNALFFMIFPNSGFWIQNPDSESESRILEQKNLFGTKKISIFYHVSSTDLVSKIAIFYWLVFSMKSYEHQPKHSTRITTAKNTCTFFNYEH